ncbi:MAG: DEAD/DEAH box helicase [Deltaproteobacteria bacterium]|nr:DEAD/DEAH box helicase [Deltaproteobacteria bacterium]
MTKDRKYIREQKAKFFTGMGVPKPAPFVPDAFQNDAIRFLEQKLDTLVIAPTGSGKTFIAMRAIENILERGGRTVYTAPLKALSNAKYMEFRSRFEPQYSVGLLTGDRKIEGDADIVVATTEIYRNELYSSRGSYDLVVLDEFHYLADSQRGPVWEESVILSPRSATLLMLSASISNPQDIAQWIETIRHRQVMVVSVEKRPVELRLGFLHPTYGVIPLEDKDQKASSAVEEFYGKQGFKGPGGKSWARFRKGSSRAG